MWFQENVPTPHLPLTGENVSVIIPSLNEADTIVHVVQGVRSLLPLAEIIVVDGDSVDGTAERAKECNIRVITRKPRGYGDAVRTGIAQSTRDIIVMVDGDGTYDISVIPTMVRRVRRGMVAIGARLPKKHEGMSYKSYIGNSLLSLLFRLIFGRLVKDTQSGLKAFPKSLAESFRANSMIFSTEIITKGLSRGLDLAEVQLGGYWRRNNGSQSKLEPMIDFFRIATFILKERLMCGKEGTLSKAIRTRLVPIELSSTA